MHIGTKFLATAALAATLGACGGQSSGGDTAPADSSGTESTSDAAQAAAANGTDAAPASQKPQAFMLCASCHSVEPGRNGVGPSLYGIVGRKAASLEGFAYSDALKASGITWDEASLDKWLAGPQKMVPSSRMVIVVPRPESRQELVNYLATLK